MPVYIFTTQYELRSDLSYTRLQRTLSNMTTLSDSAQVLRESTSYWVLDMCDWHGWPSYCSELAHLSGWGPIATQNICFYGDFG